MSRKLTAKSLLKEVRNLKKIASQEYKEKLLALLRSKDPETINQALSLNESLDLLTEQEIGDMLIPFVIKPRGSNYRTGPEEVFWEQNGLGWFLLETIPNHPYWDKWTSANFRFLNLTSIPKEIGNLKNLKQMDLRGNNLTSIPKEIGNLKKLEYLDLFENKLTSIPKEIGNLKDLGYLNFIGNNLTSIPKEIGNLNKLVYLILSENKLTSIPKEIGNLTKLKYLSLSENNLTSIPKEIGNLTNLHSLGLCGNNLTSIPKEIGNLDVRDFSLPKSLTSIPEEVAERVKWLRNLGVEVLR